MPNHITNRLRINGTPEQITEVREAILETEPKEGEEARIFDFERLLPMPDSLHCTSGGESDIAKFEMDHHDSVGHPYKPPSHVYERANKELVEICKENIRLHGHPTWYEWSIGNWGTKWGAYLQVEVEPNLIQFDTAWSCPIPVLTALAAKFPEVQFVVEFADEDVGSNQGTLVFENGELFSRTEIQGDKNRRMFAYRLKGYGEETIAEYEQEHEEWLKEEAEAAGEDD